MFEVLHYIGSCLLKVIKTKLKGVSKKQRKLIAKVDQQQQRKRLSTDEDPFLASIRRTKNINSHCLHNEGKLQKNDITHYTNFKLKKKSPCVFLHHQVKSLSAMSQITLHLQKKPQIVVFQTAAM